MARRYFYKESSTQDILLPHPGKHDFFEAGGLEIQPRAMRFTESVD